ncbi:PREDICTED: olfactory receptor 6C65-like [Branchiostoma belcheri]|uniref:Olfactory receptor 6C65-like n=1 Tax=Branchiostoma belcheri TaxID=7741 RepID=A0A6P5A1H3_BRABE|nr:PREDICTED: olfactory receptor 6C65-like [Branchiostoma belcheri]
MEEEASGSFDSMYNAFRSLEALNSRLSLGLQTVYLVLSLVVAVGCGLLLIYLVWKKEYLRKPRHYLRCNLAVDDIIFTTCIITTEICFLFSQDDTNDQQFCMVQVLVVHPSTICMFGTYLLMAIELYYFICKPLHYNGEVTTKRVAIGIVAVRAIAMIFGFGPLVVKRLQSSGDSLRCGPEPIGSTSASAVFRSVGQGGIVLAVLVIFLLYFFVLKEARKQQERDEHRNLWLCQTKAFRTMAPHAIVVIVSAATLAFVSASFRSLFNGDGRKAAASLLLTAQVAKLLNITVSSMVNPIVYSFGRPEFRRALRELCSRPPDALVAQGMKMAVFNIHIAPTTPRGERQQGKEAPRSPVQTQATGQEAPLPGQCTQQTPQPNRPVVLTVQAEVHASPPPRPQHHGQKTAPPEQHRQPEVHPSPPPCPQHHGQKTGPPEQHRQPEVHPSPPPCPQHHGQKTAPPEQHRQELGGISASMSDTPMDVHLTSLRILVDDSDPGDAKSNIV